MNLSVQLQHMLAEESVKIARPSAAYLCSYCNGWFTADHKRIPRPDRATDVALRYCPGCVARKVKNL